MIDTWDAGWSVDWRNTPFSSNDSRTLYGTTGSDRLIGGADDNTIFGDAGDDIIEGNDGNDTLFGELGNDRLSGGNGNDTLFGEAGNNILSGDAGNDYLLAEGSEVDILIGGAGADKFGLATAIAIANGVTTGKGVTYKSAGNSDYALITDFNLTEDIIQLPRMDETQVVEYSLAATPSGLPTGTGIFANNLGAKPELIAILQNIAPNSVSLSQPYFSFLDSPAGFS